MTLDEKMAKDWALTLGELAQASGWSRNTLAQMRLPLQFGKLSLSDFKRVLHRRQDAQDARMLANLSRAGVRAHTSTALPNVTTR